MGSRLELHNILLGIANNNHVYYQPPTSIRIQYPAIIYSRMGIDMFRADDNWYAQNNKYKITVIDKNPESDMIDKIARLPMCSHMSHYFVDGLNHDVFSITY